MQLAGNAFLLISVLVFVAVLLLIEGLYLLWHDTHGPDATKLRKRLQTLSAVHADPEARLLRRRMAAEMPFLDRLVLNMPRLHALDRLLQQAGLAWTVPKVLLGCVACAIAAWAALSWFAHQGLLIALAGAVLGAAAPLSWVAYVRHRRLRHIEAQLPDALDLIARSLRAGHAFSSTLDMAGEELPEPIGGEFRFTHDEINFGISVPQALTNLSERIPITDMRYFTVAVLIQRESGGNLTEILVNLSRLVRDRLKLQARVRVLSSEGRMSAWILTLLPFLLAGVMNIFNPKFMSPLWSDPIGIEIVKWMLILMAVGVAILRRIVRVRY